MGKLLIRILIDRLLYLLIALYGIIRVFIVKGVIDKIFLFAIFITFSHEFYKTFNQQAKLK
ncbi:hypothetical protein V518_0436 [Thermoanaerobacterium aotearoense SCUT27]|uniref:Uncharacterized protein n=2 Tax=Thermoanaerobacterium TaxID=28895 RepID=W9EDV9_9THEO|nr:hypothetical protein Tsac_0408 [Thermoanaerobacterium saccharolyticum JW/SL-YS485]ETO39396.1 hypothetical protein V518_0436 [Thermoanaerobacterium aotearoense SCUT27]